MQRHRINTLLPVYILGLGHPFLCSLQDFLRKLSWQRRAGADQDVMIAAPLPSRLCAGVRPDLCLDPPFPVLRSDLGEGVGGKNAEFLPPWHPAPVRYFMLRCEELE